MLRKVFAIAALALLPTVAHAQFQQGDWELTLSGSGFNGPDFDGVSAAVNGSLGNFVSKELEIGVRQSLTYSDLVSGDGEGSAWSGATGIFADYHFDMDRWQPFIGASGGYAYGDLVDDTFFYGPEAGVKYFVNPTTFILLMAQYQVFCDEGEDFLDDGQFIYTLGIGFRW